MTSPISSPGNHLFQVPDMSCNHCVKTITQKLNETFPQSTVVIDLAKHQVAVESEASTAEIMAAISEAGYQPQVA